MTTVLQDNSKVSHRNVDVYEPSHRQVLTFHGLDNMVREFSPNVVITYNMIQALYNSLKG